ncbi:uncharacterized protein ACO6RY_09908 [Pungitius sinensis]
MAGDERQQGIPAQPIMALGQMIGELAAIQRDQPERELAVPGSDPGPGVLGGLRGDGRGMRLGGGGMADQAPSSPDRRGAGGGHGAAIGGPTELRGRA